MSDIARLGIAVDSRSVKTANHDLNRFTRTSKDAANANESLGKASGRARDKLGRFTKQANSAEKASAKVAKSARAAAVGLASIAGVLAGVRAYTGASEAYTKMANSLRAMGLAADEVTGTIQSIANVAERTRAPLEATAQLYQRISIAGKDLGASQAQVLRFTENVGLALAQAGTSATEASGALLQLSQAMAGGTVRAEEFNSILEGAFPIAQAAANGIEEAAGSVGKLRQMVVEGKVSSAAFFEAILSQSTALEQAFAQTVPTIGQAFGVLGDRLTLFIGQLDQSTGATSAVAKAVLLLAENMNFVAGGITAAALTATVAYAPAIYGAVTATGAWVASLITLRGALIASGIGILIVGAGYLIGKFLDLVQATGGWGNALKLLGEVAAGVWSGIVTSSSAIVPGLQATWLTVQAGFLSMLEAMAKKWADFLHGIAESLRGVEGFEFAFEYLGNQAILAGSKVYELGAAVDQVKDSADRAKKSAGDLVVEGFDAAKEAAKKLTDAVSGVGDSNGAAADSANDLNAALGKLKKPTKGAGKELEDAKAAAEAFAKALKDAGFTAEEWGTQQAQILIGGIDSVSNAWGEFVARGFSDFKGFARSVLDSFKQMLVQMIAMAAKNRILIGLGFGGVSATGLASQAVGAAVGGGGGLLGGLLGSASAGGGILAGLWSGLGGILSGGGLGASFATLGGLATGTVSGLGAIGAAIPALGIIAAGLSLIIGKTKELDHGLRVTVHGFDNLIQTFSKTQTSRLFGLIKRRRTRYRTADAEIADPISDAIADIQDSVVRAAGILGFGAESFDDFRASIKLSTKGLSDEEIVAEIQKQLATIGDGMAEMVLGEFEVLKVGETAGQALTRLANSLTAVHSVADTLGHTFDQVGIAGAALASDLVDAFGSIEAMNAATGRYFELFYGEDERRAIVVRQTAQALEALNVQMPATRDQYRVLIEAQDLTTVAGQAAYAALISLAETMDFVLPAISSYTAEMQELANVALGVVDDLSASAAEMARQAATASANWKSASTALSGLVGSLINADNSTAARQRALGYNRSAYEASVAATFGGDASAARSLPGLARSYLDSARSVAGNYVEYFTTMARISADASSLVSFSDTEAQRHDAIASLHERQIDLLAGIRDQIGAGGLSADELNALVSGSAGLTAQSAGAQLSAAASPSGGGLGTTQAQSAEMIAELRALKSEIASFKEEQRQLGLATVKNTGTIAKIKKKEDAIS